MDVSMADAMKVLNYWAAEGIEDKGFVEAMRQMILNGHLKMVIHRGKYAFVNADNTLSKVIRCDCGEAIAVAKGMKFTLNEHAKTQFRAGAGKCGELVGFSRTPGVIRVLFEGNKTPTEFSISHLHDSEGHKSWEGKIHR